MNGGLTVLRLLQLLRSARLYSSALVSFRWATNTFSIQGGKPLWVDPFDPDVQHIFIDDNIRQNDEDTIVHPKVEDAAPEQLPVRRPSHGLFWPRLCRLLVCLRCF